MASFSPPQTLFHHILLIFHLLPSLLPVATAGRHFSAIFALGNSLTDTGNLVYFNGDTEAAAHLPYGETYFHHPTGRYSDGRIVIDFIAQASGLPLVPPYRAGNSICNFRQGANFAVAGACALGNAFFAAQGMNVTWKDYSLTTQVGWLDQLLQRSFPSLPHNPSKAKLLSKSLVFLGEMGINDYAHLLIDKNARPTIQTYVPAVVGAIGSAVNALIERGARTVIVADIYPIGCSALFLTFFQTQAADDYDPETGCLKWVNDLVSHHNLQLKRELHRLQRAHPSAKILYGDYYEPLMAIYRNPGRFGIKEPIISCCGGAGPYNFSLPVPCGAPTSTLCGDPSSYVCWDGLHLTEAVNEFIARRLMRELAIKMSKRPFENATAYDFCWYNSGWVDQIWFQERCESTRKMTGECGFKNYNEKGALEA